MHGCVCVCVYVRAHVHECMLVCQMDSIAFPCLSSFLPIFSQSSSFLDSILTASPSQGVWEWAPGHTSLPAPHHYCLSIHPTKLAQLQ